MLPASHKGNIINTSLFALSVGREPCKDKQVKILLKVKERSV